MYHHPWYMPHTVVKSGTILGTDCTVNSHDWYLFCVCSKYKGCPESIQPFLISQELVAWPGCNLAASQRRPYWASVNSLSPVGLVSRQWDAVDWPCVLCDRSIHNDRASRSASSWQCACSFYSSHAGFLGKASNHPDLSAPLQLRIGSLRLLAFPKLKNTVEREKICECDGHTVQKLSQWRLTAEWLAPQDSGCSRMYSKVSSDWLPSYMKATRPVLKIFKMAGYCLDSPHTATRIEVTRNRILGTQTASHCRQSMFNTDISPQKYCTVHLHTTPIYGPNNKSQIQADIHDTPAQTYIYFYFSLVQGCTNFPKL